MHVGPQGSHRSRLGIIGTEDEPVDPSLIYFRTTPKFETGSEKYRWLMQHLFIGSAARHADRVVIDVHQVL